MIYVVRFHVEGKTEQWYQAECPHCGEDVEKTRTVNIMEDVEVIVQEGDPDKAIERGEFLFRSVHSIPPFAYPPLNFTNESAELLPMDVEAVVLGYPPLLDLAEYGPGNVPQVDIWQF